MSDGLELALQRKPRTRERTARLVGEAEALLVQIGLIRSARRARTLDDATALGATGRTGDRDARDRTKGFEIDLPMAARLQIHNCRNGAGVSFSDAY